MMIFRSWLKCLNYAPDEGGGGSAPATPAAGDAASAGSVTASAAGQAGGSATPPAAPAVPASGGDGAPAGTPTPTPGAAPAAPAQPSWLQGLREASGFDLGSDEKAAMTQLAQTLQQYRQLQQLAPYVQSYQQHAPAFSRWLQEQGRAQQQPAPQAQPPSWKQQFWNPPEFNPSWATMLRKDEQGNLQVVPGAPPDILPKYQAYHQYRQEFAEKFLANPIDTFEPIVRQIVQEQAQQLVEQRLGQQHAQQSARQFVMENSAWLYERDPQGNVMQQSIWNPTTAQMQAIPQLSQWGQKFQQYVQQEAQEQHRRGYMDEQRQQQVAMAMIQRDYAVAQLQSRQQQAPPAPAAPAAPPPNPRDTANLDILRRTNPAAAVPPTNGNAVPGKKKVNRMNFQDILRQEMAANGINDQTLNNT